MLPPKCVKSKLRYRKHLDRIKNIFCTSFHNLPVSSVTTAVEMQNSSSLMRTKNSLPEGCFTCTADW